MTGELNDDSKDLLYVGRNEEIIQGIKRKIPSSTIIKQIDNYQDLRQFLIDKRRIFDLVIRSGAGMSGYRTESAIYPRLILCEPEFPEFKDGTGDTAEEVYFIESIRKYLISPTGYLLLTDNFYGSSREKIILDCKAKDVPIIEQGELESRILEFLN